MKVAYILSPARSGSTFLQMLLSAHSQVVGIGETCYVLREYCQTDIPKNPAHTGRCSCGSSPETCPFWGGVLRDLPDLSMSAGFVTVLDRFEELFPDKVLVDSSKSGSFLEDYYLVHTRSSIKPSVSLKIIYLVRDFRGWATSIKKHRLNKNNHNLWNSSVLLNSYRWLYTSIKWLRRIGQYNVPTLPVYYEHLVFDTENQIRRIYDFLDLPYASNINLIKADVHELYGSLIMRDDPHKLAGVVYDDEWMRDVGILAAGLLLILPAIFNSVYAHKAKEDGAYAAA